MSRLLLLTAAAALSLCAQTPVAGPSIGFVFDARGHVLRPVLGIPGASTFGNPPQAGKSLASAAIALRQNVAIVNDGAWKTVALGDPQADAVALPDGLPASARVVLSETGTAAVFYDADNSALSVVTGIGSAAPAVAAVSLDGLPGAITAMAAADDGSLLVSASVPDGGESLVWIGKDGSIRQLATLQSAASILVWNHGGNALVADRAGNQVWNIKDPGGNAAVTLLASDRDGVSAPAGAALSADGKRLWIANKGTHSVIGMDTESHATISLDCSFDMTALTPMTDGQTFRLNELNGGPMWILDAAPGTDARIVFVPALLAPAADSAAGSDEAAQL
jgi:hypothetical protein